MFFNFKFLSNLKKYFVPVGALLNKIFLIFLICCFFYCFVFFFNTIQDARDCFKIQDYFLDYYAYAHKNWVNEEFFFKIKSGFYNQINKNSDINFEQDLDQYLSSLNLSKGWLLFKESINFIKESHYNTFTSFKNFCYTNSNCWWSYIFYDNIYVYLVGIFTRTNFHASTDSFYLPFMFLNAFLKNNHIFIENPCKFNDEFDTLADYGYHYKVSFFGSIQDLRLIRLISTEFYGLNHFSYYFDKTVNLEKINDFYTRYPQVFLNSPLYRNYQANILVYYFNYCKSNNLSIENFKNLPLKCGLGSNDLIRNIFNKRDFFFKPSGGAFIDDSNLNQVYNYQFFFIKVSKFFSYFNFKNVSIFFYLFIFSLSYHITYQLINVNLDYFNKSLVKSYLMAFLIFILLIWSFFVFFQLFSLSNIIVI